VREAVINPLHAQQAGEVTPQKIKPKQGLSAQKTWRTKKHQSKKNFLKKRCQYSTKGLDFHLHWTMTMKGPHPKEEDAWFHQL